jgi:hypothetical protein
VFELFVANGVLASGMGFNSPALTSLIHREGEFMIYIFGKDT